MKISLLQRNITILKKITEYCDQIDEAVEIFGKSKDVLVENSVYRNATAMCILQIGELTTHLTTEFKNKFTMIPWQKIKDMRNVAAHHYGRLDDNILWETITEDISSLRDYCNECIAELEKDEAVEYSAGSATAKRSSRYGVWKGKYSLPEGFDEPLDD